MDRQKKSFMKPVESCPHRLKITWKELGRQAQKYWIAYLKNIFLNMLSNTSWDFISAMKVNDHRRYDR